MKLKKTWIKVNNDESQTEVNEVEAKEENKEMGFFQKHKKGLIIGGIGALAAGAAGIYAAVRNSRCNDDEDEFDDFDDEENDSDDETSEE